MANSFTFSPAGPSVLVGVTAVQVPCTAGSGVTGFSFRVRCLVAAYLTWGSTSGVTAVGGPGVNTLGMAAGGVETFAFPAASWFIANVAAAFEISPGDGM